MMITVEIDTEQVSEITRQSLVDDLELIENSELMDAMHKVIAYYSVPGQYMDGKHDLPDTD